MLKPRIDDLKTMIFIIMAMFLLVFVSFVGAQTEFAIEDYKTATPTTTVVSYESLRKLIGTSDIYNNSITNDKLAEPVSIANGGTGKTTAAEALAALGGASLNGSSTVAFNASTINGVAPLTANEKTQALVGSTTVNFLAKDLTATYFISLSKTLSPISASSVVTFTELGAVNASTHAGLLYVQNSSNGDTTILSLANASTTFVVGDTQIGVTKDEDTNINVYVESGYVRIQNTYTSAANVRVLYVGAKY